MSMVEREGVHVGPDGRRIGWAMRGPEDGAVVGWLHGQPGSRHDVRLFDEPLQRYGLRMLAIDRAGWGDTDPAGTDRRVVAGDLLAVADHLEIETFPLMGVSMGGIYALTLAALAPERISRMVLVSAHVLPYDDEAVVSALSPAERDDLDLLRRGRSAELEAHCARVAADAADVDGAVALLGQLAESMSPLEQRLVATPFARGVAESVAHGFSRSHVGYLEDGLRTLRPLEVDLADVTCPVRFLHGTADDLEPYANLDRALARLADAAVVALPGLGHFGPWVWPELPFAVLVGD